VGLKEERSGEKEEWWEEKEMKENLSWDNN
jgi:hypothetical protein